MTKIAGRAAARATTTVTHGSTRTLTLALLSLCAIGCYDGYRVYAVQYATSTGVPASYLIADAGAAETLDMSWHFYVAVGTGRTAGRVLLVDAASTYFETEAANPAFFKTYWKVNSHRSVAAALAPLGITPAQVTDVLVSHWHWDHFEGIRLFPNAHVYMPGAEWDEARTQYLADLPIQLGWVPSILPVMSQIEGEGRLHRLSPDAGATLALGQYPTWQHVDAAVSEGGKHTAHFTVMTLHCSDDRLLYIAGDSAYTYRNLEQGVAIAKSIDPVANVADMRNLMQVAGGISNIVPGHDPQVFTRYPTVAPGIVKLCP